MDRAYGLVGQIGIPEDGYPVYVKTELTSIFSSMSPKDGRPNTIKTLAILLQDSDREYGVKGLNAEIQRLVQAGVAQHLTLSQISDNINELMRTSGVFSPVHVIDELKGKFYTSVDYQKALRTAVGEYKLTPKGVVAIEKLEERKIVPSQIASYLTEGRHYRLVNSARYGNSRNGR